MNETERISASLEDLGEALRKQPSIKDRIVQELNEPDDRERAVPKAWFRSRIAKAVAATAACLLVAMTVWLTTGHDGASQVFAAAMENVRRARTFSCKWTAKGFVTEDGRERMSETLIMFKEPNLERREELTAVLPELREVTIRDWEKRRELCIYPAKKIAYLVDRSSDYVVDESTGKLKLSELDTSVRDMILRWSKGEVEDLGMVELDGESVRLLQSRRGKWIIKIWIAPKTRLPVRVEVYSPGRPDACEIYASIRFNVELDDALFRLEPPDGYRVKDQKKGGWSDYQTKLNAKMAYLALACWRFHNKHDGRFPNDLRELKAIGIKEEVLKTVLAAPGRPDGPDVIRYRQPPPDADASTFVLLYEAFDEWPKDGLVVGFVDGHRSIADREHFEKLVPDHGL